MAQLKDKVPPHNLDAEQAALGSLLLDWDVLGDVIKYLRPERFYSLQNQLPHIQHQPHFHLLNYFHFQ